MPAVTLLAGKLLVRSSSNIRSSGVASRKACCCRATDDGLRSRTSALDNVRNFKVVVAIASVAMLLHLCLCLLLLLLLLLLLRALLLLLLLLLVHRLLFGLEAAGKVLIRFASACGPVAHIADHVDESVQIRTDAVDQ